MHTAGFHYYRAQLDAGVAGDPAQAHARRGAHWTFDAPAFVACVRSLRDTSSSSIPSDDGDRGSRNGDREGTQQHEGAAVAVPSFAHGVGDPVPNDIRVVGRHQVLLVEGNYLLLGAPVGHPSAAPASGGSYLLSPPHGRSDHVLLFPAATWVVSARQPDAQLHCACGSGARPGAGTQMRCLLCALVGTDVQP